MSLSERIIASPEDVQADTDKLVRFISMYCKAHHQDRDRLPFFLRNERIPARAVDGPPICGECTKLLRHAIVMRVLCPLDPKPKCRKCPQHCYRPVYREQMETVMKYAGPRSLFNRG
jgi:hypothetical protein